MKLYNKTLLDLDHKLDLSRVGATTSCFAAPFHETAVYATEAVAKHRAISKEVRTALSLLIQKLDHYDKDVEDAFQTMRLEMAAQIESDRHE